MAVDTDLKRFSAINVGSPWRGILPFPDGAITSSADRQTIAFLYSGVSATPPPATAAITGTVLGTTEANIVAGGRTIIITLTNDTWVASGGTFNAQRQAILDGLDSAGAEPTGWNAVVRDAEVVAAVVRTSDTVVTITLSAAPTYNIAASETVTVTVPAAALVGAVPVIGAPTFSISAIAPSSTTPDGAGNLNWLNRGPGKKKRKGKVIRFSDFETREAYEAELEKSARALAAESIPVSAIAEDGSVEDDDLEDDEIILMALTRILH